MRVARVLAGAVCAALVAVISTGCAVPAASDQDPVAAFVNDIGETPVPSTDVRSGQAAAADRDMLSRLATAAVSDPATARAVVDDLNAVPVPESLFGAAEVAVHPRRAAGAPTDAGRAAEPSPLQAVKTAGLAMYLAAMPRIADPSHLTDGTEQHAAEGPVSTAYAFDGQRLTGTVTLATSSTDPATPASMTSQLEFDVQGCPASDGSFTAEVRGSGRLDISTPAGSGTVESWASESWSVAVTGRVGDDAYISDASVSHRQEMTGGQAGGGSRNGIDFASEWNLAFSRDAEGEQSMTPGGLPRIGRSSSAISAVDEIRLLANQWSSAQLQTVIALDAVEGILRSGLCVDLVIEAPASLPLVEPGSTTTVVARPVLHADGSPAGGVVAARVVDGKGAIEPATGTAPSTHFYAAPFENDHTTVRFESTSPAGIGEATRVFAVGGGWQAVIDVGDVHTEGQKCGPVTGEWTLAAAGRGWEYTATAVVRIGADLTGTYTITGSTEVSAFDGSGTAWLEPSGEDYLMYFDTSDRPIMVTRDASMYGCAYETD